MAACHSLTRTLTLTLTVTLTLNLTLTLTLTLTLPFRVLQPMVYMKSMLHSRIAQTSINCGHSTPWIAKAHILEDYWILEDTFEGLFELCILQLPRDRNVMGNKRKQENICRFLNHHHGSIERRKHLRSCKLVTVGQHLLSLLI